MAVKSSVEKVADLKNQIEIGLADVLEGRMTGLDIGRIIELGSKFIAERKTPS